MFKYGTYPAQRWEKEGDVNLYHCPDAGRNFFVEVGVADGLGQAEVLRSFVSVGPLADYAYGVRLPEE